MPGEPHMTMKGRPMSIEIRVPELGENIKDGDIVNVLVAVGDEVAKDQPIVEIETGKAAVEMPSPEAGRVEKVHVKAGDKVKIGQALFTFAASGQPGAGPVVGRPPPEARAPAAKPSAAKAPKVASVEPAPSSPPAAEPPAAPPTAPPEPAVEAPLSRPASRVPVAAAPSVRRFAREIGVNVEEVVGHGAGGRISIDDVKRHARQINTGRRVQGHCALEAVPLPDFTKWGPVQKESMTRLRVTAAEHLSRAWATIPHVTQHDQADVTELEELRKRFAPRAEAAGGKLTLTAILLKVLAAALKVFPKFNASVDLSAREVIYKRYIHVGVAVDTERGLLVPVLRDVDRKSIVQLAVELGALAKKAREGRIAPDDLQGGTFTLTNLGGIGGSFFTPIINAPEVAILGVGRSTMAPVCAKGETLCRPRLMLPLSLSYDHRLIDGADGARFLRWVIEAIEEPMLISLEG